MYGDLDRKEINSLCVAICKPHTTYIKLVYPFRYRTPYYTFVVDAYGLRYWHVSNLSHVYNEKVWR